MELTKPEMLAKLDGYPNLRAMMQGCVSGHHTEWPMLRMELRRLMDAHEASLARQPEDRDTVLEEAAKECERLACDAVALPSGALRDAYAMDCAKALRALKRSHMNLHEGTKE